MVKNSHVIAFMLAAVVTAGCSGGDEAAAPKRQASGPATTPPAAQAKAIRFGQAQTLDEHGWKVTATVYGYRQPLAGRQKPDNGYIHAGLDTKICPQAAPAGQQATLSVDPWSLSYADNTLAEPYRASPGEFPVPLYPQFEKPVPLGKCVRGWVIFQVPQSQKPTRAAYALTNPTGAPFTPLHWAIP